MQLAGSNCRQCHQPILLATDAKSCDTCQIAVHLACDPAQNCPVCHHPFQKYHPPKRDPRSESYDPRQKNPGKYTALLLASLLMALGALLVLYLLTLT